MLAYLLLKRSNEFDISQLGKCDLIVEAAQKMKKLSMKFLRI